MTGKTEAFCLSVLQLVWEILKNNKANDEIDNNVVVIPWTMSLFDCDNAISIAPDRLQCRSKYKTGWHGCRATSGIQGGGRFYYEATITGEKGLCRIGWSTKESTLKLGKDVFSYGFGGTGQKSCGNIFKEYGEPFGRMDVIGCMLNTIDWEIKYSKNGLDFGSAFIIGADTRNRPLYPAVLIKNSELSLNFGAEPFKYGPPPGFVGLSTVPNCLIASNPFDFGNCKAVKGPLAIVIEPTRELAQQTFNHFRLFKKYLCDQQPALNEMLLVAGENVAIQLKRIQQGVDIIVATPGRLDDLIEGGQISLAHCRFFVLNKAEALLKAGYIDSCERIHKQIPKVTSDGRRRLQSIVCCANLHDFGVKTMVERMMHFPSWIDLNGFDDIPETLHHVVLVNPVEDDRWHSLSHHIQTDGVHTADMLRPDRQMAETFSEAVKVLKAEYLRQAIDEHQIKR